MGSTHGGFLRDFFQKKTGKNPKKNCSPFLRIELHLFYFSPPARWGSLDFISQRIDMTVEVICHVIGGFPQLQHWPWQPWVEGGVSTCSLLWSPRCYCTDGTPPTISKWYVGSTIDLVGDTSILHWPYKVPLVIPESIKQDPIEDPGPGIPPKIHILSRVAKDIEFPWFSRTHYNFAFGCHWLSKLPQTSTVNPSKILRCSQPKPTQHNWATLRSKPNQEGQTWPGGSGTC